MWYEVILDALKDTAILFPFLFLMYILIEALEHNTGVGSPRRSLAGKCAPLVGTALGIVPMCGFSVMAAKLYRHRHITIGTLLAVFIATSDEAFLVMLTTPVMSPLNKTVSILSMIGIKVVLGIVVGYLADLTVKRRETVEMPEILHERHDHAHEEHEEYTACEHTRKSKVHLYLVSPLLHALEVAAAVFAVNLAFGFLFRSLGEENVVSFLRAGKWLQPLVCAVVGLIPNCASSVVLAETYAIQGIEFGSCLAGLIVNAGLGYLALFRGKGGARSAIVILSVIFALGLGVGYAVNALALLI